MRPDQLRSVLLIKAIEEVDRDGTVLPLADRDQATREALRQIESTSDLLQSPQSLAELEKALAIRSARLMPPLEQRYPVVGEMRSRELMPRWMPAALLFGALVLGILLSVLDGGRHINILAFPFLGVILWNLLVYVGLFVGWLRGQGRHSGSSKSRTSPFERSLSRGVAPLLSQTAQVHRMLGEALSSFASQWASYVKPLFETRAKRLFHLAAAIVALGLIAGLYLRGIVFRYEAGWESTFLGPSQVNYLLTILFGPASSITGIPLPGSLDEIEALRWGSGGGGGDAAPWIHLIAVTLAIYVIVPRLVLAGMTLIRTFALQRSRPLPDDVLEYGRAAIAGMGGGTRRRTGVVSVTPYAYVPGRDSYAGLERMLEARANSDIRLDHRSPLRYGEEDSATETFDSGAHRIADEHVLLFSLAATPEAENHGAVLAAARDSADRAKPATRLLVIVDESPYRERLAGDSTLESRLEERRELWTRFVSGYGMKAVLADLVRQPE